MAVHGTENFVYYTDKVLGSGSTGTVYFGRHKRRGDACAVKLFSSSSGSRTRTQVQENELEFMRRLQHKNIVVLLAIEKDSKTAEVALIMELCSEGSLQKRLSEPEFVHGLNEKEFVVFLIQFVAGLSYLRLHGVTHRDIKPGNILCHKQEDGCIVYKITDFGSSCELLGEDKSKALYGTEEYLHPAIYRCIFIEKSRYGNEYESHAELWSIGVTLYQVATGQLPFRVQGGRNNREMMFHIISKKASGVISSIQREGYSENEISTELPATCSFSRGFRDFLTPIIAGLIENNISKQMTFESFFPKCEELESLLIVYVFCVVTCAYFHIYVKPTDTYSHLQLAIEKMSEIPVAKQFLMFDKKWLNESVTPESTLQLLPRTTQDDPIILVIVDQRAHFPSSEFPQLANVPSALPEKNLNTDAVWARDVCSYFIQCEEIVKSLASAQRLTLCSREWLVAILVARIKTLEIRRTELESNWKIVDFNATAFPSLLRKLLEDVNRQIATVSESEKSSSSSSLLQKAAMISDFERSMKPALAHILEWQESIRSMRSFFESSFEKVDVRLLNTEKRDDSGCESCRCLTRILFNIKLGKTTYDQFAKDRKRQLTYNEDQIHKYEKIKLEQKIKAVTSIIFTHCLPESVKINEEFRQWLLQKYLKKSDEISRLERSIETIKSEFVQLRDFISKSHVDSRRALDGFLKKDNTGQKEPLKSSGYYSQQSHSYHSSQPLSGSSLKETPPTEFISPSLLKSQMQRINQCYEESNKVMRNIQDSTRANEEVLSRFEDY